jgi:hypothetical protein
MKIVYIDKDTELLSNDNKNIIFFIPEKREERSFISCFTFFFTSIVISYAFTIFILSLIFTKEELINYTSKYKSI